MNSTIFYHSDCSMFTWWTGNPSFCFRLASSLICARLKSRGHMYAVTWTIVFLTLPCMVNNWSFNADAFTGCIFSYDLISWPGNPEKGECSKAFKHANNFLWNYIFPNSKELSTQVILFSKRKNAHNCVILFGYVESSTRPGQSSKNISRHFYAQLGKSWK